MLEFQTTQSPGVEWADDEPPLLIRLNFQYSSLPWKQCRILRQLKSISAMSIMLNTFFSWKAELTWMCMYGFQISQVHEYNEHFNENPSVPFYPSINLFVSASVRAGRKSFTLTSLLSGSSRVRDPLAMGIFLIVNGIPLYTLSSTPNDRISRLFISMTVVKT